MLRPPTLLVPGLIAAVALAAPATPGAQPLDTPAAVYQASCAACHGPDGTGQPAALVGFDTPLPDFTDCSFASREPAADWFAVAHAGGPVRGFDPLMPSFGQTMTDEQLEMAIEHVYGFCDDDAWPRGELNLPRALFTGKAYPEDELVWELAVTTEGPAVWENVFLYEKRFGARNQWEIAVPFDFRERPGQPWSGGLGDVALGVKRAFWHNGRRATSIVSGGLEVILPTGDPDTGRGKGTTVFEPFVAYGQALPADSFLQLLVAIELPIHSDRAQQEGIWRGALGKSFVSGRFGRTWSPMVEVLGARGLETDEKIQWDVVPQMQVTLNTRQHVMANAGVRIPATDADVRSATVVAYLLWDWFDGGFFEGW